MPATHGDFTHRHGAGSEQLDFQSASGSVPASEQRASTLSADSPCYPKERPGFSAQRQEEPGTGQTIACFHLALAGGFHRKTCEPLSGLNLHLKSCFLGWGWGGKIFTVLSHPSRHRAHGHCADGDTGSRVALSTANANAIWTRSGFLSPPCSSHSSCCPGFQT